jgi:hypothetical protein
MPANARRGGAGGRVAGGGVFRGVEPENSQGMTALVSMGFERDAAAAALLQTRDNLEQTVALLTGEKGEKAGHSLAARTRTAQKLNEVLNFIVGLRVKAKWKAAEGGKKWFKGQVKLVKPGGKYYIVYDDGDVEHHVLECNSNYSSTRISRKLRSSKVLQLY